MIVLYILLGILAFLLLLFHIAIRITIEYNESFSLKIGVLFFNYDVTKPRKKKPKKEKEKKEKKPKKEKKKKEASSVAEETKKKPKKKISDIVGFVSFIIRIASAATKRMTKLIPIKLYYFEACCASPEAEETALQYARLSNIAYALFEALGRFARFTYSPERVYIYPDYTKEKSVYKVKLLIKIRLVYLLNTGFAALKVILKEFSSVTPSRKNASAKAAGSTHSPGVKTDVKKKAQTNGNTKKS